MKLMMECRLAVCLTTCAGFALPVSGCSREVAKEVGVHVADHIKKDLAVEAAKAAQKRLEQEKKP